MTRSTRSINRLLPTYDCSQQATVNHFCVTARVATVTDAKALAWNTAERSIGLTFVSDATSANERSQDRRKESRFVGAA